MMCDKNPESRDVERCRGCLSPNRRLCSVATSDYIFLLTAKQKVESGRLRHIPLCWECTARLRGTRRFQAQVQRAHKILQDSLPLSLATPTLSVLSISQHIEYDAVFEETELEHPLFETTSSDIKHEIIIVPTKYKSEGTKSIEEYEKKYVIDQRNLKNVNDDDNIKSEPPSDDSEEIDAEDGNFNSSEEMTDEDDDLETDDKNRPTIVKQPKQSNKTIKCEASSTLNIKDEKKTIIKTPALLNLEKQLQKLFEATNPVPRTKKKQEEDPDFEFEEDEDSGVNKAENEGKKKRVWCGRPLKFHRIITRYGEFADVLPYFSEIKMTANDIKSTLEKDDAIVIKETPLKCGLCGMMFQNARSIKHHGRVVHKSTHPNLFVNGNFCNPAPVLPKRSVWQCNVCSRTMRQEHIVAHMDKFHRQTFACIAGGCEWRPDTFWEKEDRDRHWEEIHRQFKCDYCNKSKPRKKTLEKHMATRHATRVNRPIVHKCHICSKILARPEVLKQHIQYVHNTVEVPVELRYCVECDTTFKRIHTFQMHFRDKHSGRPKPECQQCGKVLRSKNSLKRHMDVVHTGKTKFCCHICGKYLSAAPTLARHLDKHNNVARPKAKTIPCTVCGRLFAERVSLKYHMYTHTGERPFKCPHCETAFTQPYCLRVHLAKQHQVEAAVRSDGTIVPATKANTAAGQ